MTFTANILDRGELTQPDADPMDPCTGPIVCRVHVVHEGFDAPTAAAWCVTIGEAPSFGACDYHADAIAKALSPYGIPVAVAPVRLLDELLDLPAARELDKDPGDREYLDDSLPEGSCLCHDSTMCPDATAEAWAPGEYTEAYGR